MPEETKTVIDADVVVLPPEDKGGSTGASKGGAGKAEEVKNASEASRIVAQWMDELFRIPGTNLRFGLDPIIGLFPGVGDFLASSIGLVTITEGVRMRVPIPVLFRMGFNVLLNDAIGTIPGFGDLFSAWFKSNSRNLKLINQWKGGDQDKVRRGGRIFLVLFIVLWFSQFFFWLLLWITVGGTIYHFVSKALGG